MLPGTGMAAIGYALKHHVGARPSRWRQWRIPRRLAHERSKPMGARCDASVRWPDWSSISDGVQAVTTSTGEVIEADFIVAACDPRRVMVDWVGVAMLPCRSSGDGRRSRLTMAMSRKSMSWSVNCRDTAPTTTGCGRLMGGVDFAAATGVISPNVDEADAACEGVRRRSDRRRAAVARQLSVGDRRHDPGRHPSRAFAWRRCTRRTP